PDVVIASVALDDLEPGLFRRLREQAPQASIVALGAGDGQREVERALRRGADRYLACPIRERQVLARVVARAMEKPALARNCAALAEGVLESELFGHVKGSFTGAAAGRKGRFEQADGGTLFLDEISEIPPTVQVKLLRFLQERELERVGGNETIRVDTRVVA